MKRMMFLTAMCLYNVLLLLIFCPTTTGWPKEEVIIFLTNHKTIGGLSFLIAMIFPFIMIIVIDNLLNKRGKAISWKALPKEKRFKVQKIMSVFYDNGEQAKEIALLSPVDSENKPVESYLFLDIVTCPQAIMLCNSKEQVFIKLNNSELVFTV